MIVKISIHSPRDFSRLWPECRTPTLQEHHGYDPSNIRIGVGSEPAIAGARARAGSRLAEDLFLGEVVTNAACCSVLNCPGHAVGDFRNDGSNIEMALDARLEIGDLFRSIRVLDVIKRAPVGDR